MLSNPRRGFIINKANVVLIRNNINAGIHSLLLAGKSWPIFHRKGINNKCNSCLVEAVTMVENKNQNAF
jgi:hypothetical protein